MTAIDSLLRQPAAQAVGWALLHFVWQGALIGVASAAALAALRRSAPDVRYVVSAIGLSLMLTMPVVTAVQSWRGSSQAIRVPAAGAATAPASSADSSSALTAARAGSGAPVAGTIGSGVEGPETPRPRSLLDVIRVEPWLPAFVLAWCCGVALLTLRLLSGWVWVQRMKTHGTRQAEDGWQRMAARLARRLHIVRRVQLLQSTLVDVPTVIGWLKPVVLLPASALAGLTPHQLEAILAHELAHIRRHDYLVNLLQTLVETLLFYHPAVWWLSRRIRTEREHCCDDLAVSLCGDPYTYAQALADLEELRGANHQLVLAASGGSLLQRVRRLLGAPTHAGHAPGWLAGSAAILVMFGIVAGAAGSDAWQGTPESRPSQTPASTNALDEREAAALARALSDQARQTMQAIREQGRRAAEALARPTLPPTASSQLTADTARLTTEANTITAASHSLTAQSDALHESARRMAEQTDPVRAATADNREMTRAMEAALPALASGVPAMPALATAALREPAIAMSRQSHGTFSWSNNGDRLEVKYDGAIEFSDDDTDVKSMSPGGYLRIKDGGWFGLGGRTVEFSADQSGRITRRYWVGMAEKPFEPDGRLWLTQALPRFVRQTGIGAPARVARILKSRGTAGVLAEISRIEGSWAKRIYFAELLNTATLDQATLRQVLEQAGREIDSDFELASLLIKSAQSLTTDDATRKAYFDAARGIGSDFEMRRVFSAALKAGPVSGPVLAGILDASQSIDSDFEEASLLVQIAKLQPLDKTTRAPFFAALGTVESDFEHRRVLSALADRADLTPEITAAMLESAAGIGSDFEAASFLLQVAKQQPIEGTLRAPFFRTLDSIDSGFERGRVLKAVVSRPDASKDTVLSALRAARGMGSSFETSQVLLAVASTHSLTGETRDAYIDAAEKLGDFEQGRVLAALVRSERRK